MGITAMNHSLIMGRAKGGSVYAGNLLFGSAGLKSTQEKMERQQKTAGEIEFWEQQKQNLKNRECASVEEIAEKLEAFHNYEDEIKAAKMAYNYEQMRHVMDEAQEMGEKIAEAAEELEPKTPEERREEEVKEAAGVEDEGILSEMLDEVLDSVDEALDSVDEVLDSVDEVLDSVEGLSGSEELSESVEALAEANALDELGNGVEDMEELSMADEIENMEESVELEKRDPFRYVPIDIRI